MAPGQFLTIRGDVREVGGEFHLDCQRCVILFLRLRPLAETREQKPQTVVARGQVQAVFGHGGEVDDERSVFLRCDTVRSLGFHFPPQAILD